MDFKVSADRDDNNTCTFFSHWFDNISNASKWEIPVNMKIIGHRMT